MPINHDTFVKVPQLYIIIRTSIHRKNINPQIAVSMRIPVIHAYVRIKHLYEGKRLPILCFPTAELNMRGQLAEINILQLQKSIKVRAGHQNVDVVIPWDKALMSHRSQQSSTSQCIIQIVFLTQGLKNL